MLGPKADHFQFHRTQGWCDDGAWLAQDVARLTQGATVKPALLAGSTYPRLHRDTAALSLPVTMT